MAKLPSDPPTASVVDFSLGSVVIRPFVGVSTWFRSSSRRQRLPAYLKQNQTDFAYDFAVVAGAWWSWRDGEAALGRAQLAQLAGQLQEGNIVHTTATWLIGEIDAGNTPPKRLEFFADEAPSESRSR